MLVSRPYYTCFRIVLSAQPLRQHKCAWGLLTSIRNLCYFIFKIIESAYGSMPLALEFLRFQGKVLLVPTRPGIIGVSGSGSSRLEWQKKYYHNYRRASLCVLSMLWLVHYLRIDSLLDHEPLAVLHNPHKQAQPSGCHPLLCRRKLVQRRRGSSDSILNEA